MKKHFGVILFVILFFVILFFDFDKSSTSKSQNIYDVLESNAYAYLPKSAKDYILEVYEKTGDIIFTEKNKKVNIPYLNPMYVSYLEMSEEEKKNEGHIPMTMKIDYVGGDETQNENGIPTHYDLRNVNEKTFITPPRNQGNFGLCWSFATMGTFESYLLRTTNTSYNPSTAKRFNERQIDYATSIDGIKDYNSEYVTYVDRTLGDGGNFYISSIALAGGVSYVDYDWKEYSDTDKEKMELYEVLNYENSLYEVNSTVNMPSIDFKTTTENNHLKDNYLNTIKEHIMEYGAVYTNTYWNDYCVYYESGLEASVVDVDPNCIRYGGGHAMIIIGWDDNVSYDYCADTTKHYDSIVGCKNIVSKKGAWILKNSWGTSDSYPYLTYDSLNTGYSFITDVQLTSSKNWDNSYVFKTDVDYAYRYKTEDFEKVNIVGTEKLNFIKFTSVNENSNFTIEINASNGKFSKNVSKELPGMITVDFSADNILVDSDSSIFINGGEVSGFFDIVQAFTSNIDTVDYIDLSKLSKVNTDSYRIYSVTKNIPSNTRLIYKFLDSFGNDVTNRLVVSNNVVAENNINTLVSGFRSLESGKYTLEVYNGDNKINTKIFDVLKMEGSGTKFDPYVIINSTQLDQIREDLDAHYVLGADIDLTDDTRDGGKFYNKPSNIFENGHGWEAIMNFSGSFDGKGHTIKGLYQRTKLEQRVGNEVFVSEKTSGIGGLFGTVRESAVIKNVVLDNFDIGCHGYCAPLLGIYEFDDYNSYEVEFSDIVVKESVVSAIKDPAFVNMGGVFGRISGNSSTNIKINNIFTETYIDSINSNKFGMLAYNVSGFNNINISNIQLQGYLEGKNINASDAAILIYELCGAHVKIENIFSTVQTFNVGGALFNNVSKFSDVDAIWTVKNVNMIKPGSYSLFNDKDSLNYVDTSNINLVTEEKAINIFTNSNSYNDWYEFDSYWDLKVIDGIARYPVLKISNFEYSHIDDITYKQVLNEKKYITDYLVPNNKMSNRFIYKSNNEDILKINDDLSFNPQSDGVANVRIENPYYDAYVRNVVVNVDYDPHYIVNFFANGAEGNMNSVEVSSINNYEVPISLFTKNYYDFKGWNTEADGTGTSYMPGDIIDTLGNNEVLNLYAQWRGDEFEVVFNANGGISPIESKILYYGEKYGDLPIPYRDGYGFDGWTVNSGDNVFHLVDPNITVFYDEVYRTLIAEWISNAYTVEFNPNGGSGYVDYMSIGLNSSKKLKDNKFSRTGYIFTGWNTEPDGSGVSYSNQEVICLDNVQNSLLKLYAQWDKAEYEVSFDSNGGIGLMDVQLFSDGMKQSLAVNMFTKDGYTFKEWNTKSDGTGKTYSDQEEITVNENLTLYAIWSINKLFITFNANDGSGKIVTQEVLWNTSVNLKDNTFKKSGFEFVNWNTKSDGSGNKYNNKENIKIKNNLVLYAIWKESYSYKISNYNYDIDKGLIDNISVGTTVGAYLNNFTLNSDYTMEVNSKSGYLYTGSKTRIYKNGTLYKEFNNIVRGDVNGDAKISSADYIKIRKHIMKSEVINSIVYFSAADVNFDGKVTSADYVKIRKIIMGG